MLDFLYIPVSWVLLQWHHLFTHLGLGAASGVNWALSIVFLVITARLLLFRLFIRQIKYQRQMAVLQPKIKELQKKYKDDRQEQQRQIMALQQEHGFNPLSGCLPLLLQWPIFIALFHVLRHLSNSVALCRPGATDPKHHLTLYTFTKTETCDAAQARLFGKAPLAARLTESAKLLHQLQGDRGILTITILVLVVISAAATFMTQKLARSANPVQPEGQAAMVANMMQYLIPIGTLGSGLFFPLGVLLYWFTSNTWTMLQQLYVNKYHPHEAVATGAPTHQVGKTLAPPPGARPVRPSRQSGESTNRAAKGTQDGSVPPSVPQPSANTASGDRTAATDKTDNTANTDGGTAARTPRPGQQPKRPNGNRPQNNRRNPSKKRR